MDLTKPTLIGVIHLAPLPGSPRYGGDLEAILEPAISDAAAYREGGADAVILENFGDTPFTRGEVAPETIAAMARAGDAVRPELGGLPVGFNVLRNDARAALGLCAACGGDFLRVNVLTGAAVTDQGIIEGDAHGLLKARSQLAPHVKILADVHVKHAQPLAGGSLSEAARDTWQRAGADALIVSGSGTGHAFDPADLETVRIAAPDAPLYLGSGTTPDNLPTAFRFATGAIVGTWVKRDGILDAPVDANRVRELATMFAS